MYRQQRTGVQQRLDRSFRRHSGGSNGTSQPNSGASSFQISGNSPVNIIVPSPTMARRNETNGEFGITQINMIAPPGASSRGTSETSSLFGDKAVERVDQMFNISQATDTPTSQREVMLTFSNDNGRLYSDGFSQNKRAILVEPSSPYPSNFEIEETRRSAQLRGFDHNNIYDKNREITYWDIASDSGLSDDVVDHSNFSLENKRQYQVIPGWDYSPKALYPEVPLELIVAMPQVVPRYQPPAVPHHIERLAQTNMPLELLYPERPESPVGYKRYLYMSTPPPPVIKRDAIQEFELHRHDDRVELKKRGETIAVKDGLVSQSFEENNSMNNRHFKMIQSPSPIPYTEESWEVYHSIPYVEKQESFAIPSTRYSTLSSSAYDIQYPLRVSKSSEFKTILPPSKTVRVKDITTQNNPEKVVRFVTKETTTEQDKVNNDTESFIDQSVQLPEYFTYHYEDPLKEQKLIAIYKENQERQERLNKLQEEANTQRELLAKMERDAAEAAAIRAEKVKQHELEEELERQMEDKRKREAELRQQELIFRQQQEEMIQKVTEEQQRQAQLLKEEHENQLIKEREIIRIQHEEKLHQEEEKLRREQQEKLSVERETLRIQHEEQLRIEAENMRREEERIRREQEERLRQEEEKMRHQQEEQLRREREILRIQYEEKLKTEEERIRTEEQRWRKKQEELARIEEENRRKHEEQLRIEEEKLRWQQEEKLRQERDILRIQYEERLKTEEEKIRIEEQRWRRKQEELARIEEENRRKHEEQLRLDEEKLRWQQEEELRQEREIMRIQYEEKLRAEEEKVRKEEEKWRRKQEELARIEEDKLRRQRLEEEKLRKERELLRQQYEERLKHEEEKKRKEEEKRRRMQEELARIEEENLRRQQEEKIRRERETIRKQHEEQLRIEEERLRKQQELLIKQREEQRRMLDELDDSNHQSFSRIHFEIDAAPKIQSYGSKRIFSVDEMESRVDTYKGFPESLKQQLEAYKLMQTRSRSRKIKDFDLFPISDSIHQTIKVHEEDDEVTGMSSIFLVGKDLDDFSGSEDNYSETFNTVDERVNLKVDSNGAVVEVNKEYELYTPLNLDKDIWRRQRITIARVIDVDLNASIATKRAFENLMKRTLMNKAWSQGKRIRLSGDDAFKVYRGLMEMVAEEEEKAAYTTSRNSKKSMDAQNFQRQSQIKSSVGVDTVPHYLEAGFGRKY